MEIISRFKNYNVNFVNSLARLNELAKSQETFFVFDAKVYGLYKSQLPSIDAERLFLLDAVEEKKNMDTVLAICEQMTNMSAKRNTHLVSVGGGIVQDITGFVASSLYRGIRWAFYPSTLLSACDSCIGGKSSLNYKGFKNLLGSFYPPDEIYIYPQFFRTLSDRDYCSGLGEVVKFNVIAGEDKFAMLENDIDDILQHDYQKLSEYVHSSLNFKKRFIEEDEFDKGVRILLNYAHTFGHALESTSDYAVPHGSAVAIGMMIANDISVQRGLLKPEYAKRVQKVCGKILKNINVEPVWLDVDALEEAIRKDKKQTGSSINAVLLQNASQLNVFMDIKKKEIEYAIEENICSRGRRACPICGRENILNKDCFQRDYRLCADIVPFDYYHVYACKNCGMVYAGDFKSSMPLDKYYEKMSRYTEKSFILSSQTKAFYEREAEFLSKYISKQAAVLDIGCAFGGLLNILREMGFKNVAGLEISTQNVSYAREELGLDVYQGGLGMNCILNNKYDVVILSGVLEHLFNIHDCIKEIKEYLKSDGKLFIIVPDLDDFANHDDLYQEFSVEHINYFSITSLKQLFALHDIRLLQSECDGIPFYGLAGNLFSLWQIGKDNISSDISFASLERYLDNCKKLAKRVKNKFLKFDMKNGFYIWCAGTQTAMLYQLNCFAPEAVKGIFDSNKNYTGEMIYGHEVMQPSELLRMPDRPILIASQYAQEAIIREIKRIGLNNEIWTL